MSYGVIGISHPSLRVIRKAQQFKELHVYDKNSTPLKCFRKVKSHPSVADLTLHMSGPRTIATFGVDEEESERTISQLLEWCDKEDTIVNMSNEKYTNAEKYAELCEIKGIHYLDAAMSNKMVIVDGKPEIFQAQELFFRMFADEIVYAGDEHGYTQFLHMIHENMECALFQAYADMYAYCNQDQSITCTLNEARKMDIDGPVLKTSISRLYNSYKYEDMAHINDKSIWCAMHALDSHIPTPVLQTSLNARMTSRYMKLVDTKQCFNKFFDRLVALQTLRFVYAMVYHEGMQLSPKIKECIKGSTLECSMFIDSNSFDIMNDSIAYARTFVMHCAHAGIPCPVVQAAVCQYDFLHQTKTSMNFIASLRR